MERVFTKYEAFGSMLATSGDPQFYQHLKALIPEVSSRYWALVGHFTRLTMKEKVELLTVSDPQTISTIKSWVQEEFGGQSMKKNDAHHQGSDPPTENDTIEQLKEENPSEKIIKLHVAEIRGSLQVDFSKHLIWRTGASQFEVDPDLLEPDNGLFFLYIMGTVSRGQFLVDLGPPSGTISSPLFQIYASRIHEHYLASVQKAMIARARVITSERSNPHSSLTVKQRLQMKIRRHHDQKIRPETEIGPNNTKASTVFSSSNASPAISTGKRSERNKVSLTVESPVLGLLGDNNKETLHSTRLHQNNGKNSSLKKSQNQKGIRHHSRVQNQGTPAFRSSPPVAQPCKEEVRLSEDLEVLAMPKKKLPTTHDLDESVSSSEPTQLDSSVAIRSRSSLSDSLCDCEDHRSMITSRESSPHFEEQIETTHQDDIFLDTPELNHDEEGQHRSNWILVKSKNMRKKEKKELRNLKKRSNKVGGERSMEENQSNSFPKPVPQITGASIAEQDPQTTSPQQTLPLLLSQSLPSTLVQSNLQGDSRPSSISETKKGENSDQKDTKSLPPTHSTPSSPRLPTHGIPPPQQKRRPGANSRRSVANPSQDTDPAFATITRPFQDYSYYQNSSNRILVPGRTLPPQFLQVNNPYSLTLALPHIGSSTCPRCSQPPLVSLPAPVPNYLLGPFPKDPFLSLCSLHPADSSFLQFFNSSTLTSSQSQGSNKQMVFVDGTCYFF